MHPTVLIAYTAAHRDTDVFDATRYGIDHLKVIMPVWKKQWVLAAKNGSREITFSSPVNE